jgi:hypothetical protein
LGFPLGFQLEFYQIFPLEVLVLVVEVLAPNWLINLLNFLGRVPPQPAPLLMTGREGELVGKLAYSSTTAKARVWCGRATLKTTK